MARLGVIWRGQFDYSAPVCRHAVMYEGMYPPRTWRANCHDVSGVDAIFDDFCSTQLWAM